MRQAKSMWLRTLINLSLSLTSLAITLIYSCRGCILLGHLIEFVEQTAFTPFLVKGVSAYEVACFTWEEMMNLDQ